MGTDLRVVIVGGGHVGYHTAHRLDNRGHDIVIVEKDEDRVEFLSDQYVATVIKGDGGRPSILRQADLERSDVLAALTNYGTMTNLGICMTGQRIAPDIRTVARIDHGDDEEYGCPDRSRRRRGVRGDGSRAVLTHRSWRTWRCGDGSSG